MLAVLNSFVLANINFKISKIYYTMINISTNPQKKGADSMTCIDRWGLCLNHKYSKIPKKRVPALNSLLFYVDNYFIWCYNNYREFWKSVDTISVTKINTTDSYELVVFFCCIKINEFMIFMFF